ncbi:MAG TPA: HEAT repeat domain-containing protein [Pirellulales bacterium]|nr:HEAT repeat domain-containing protein [Pirellulales bacterium]
MPLRSSLGTSSLAYCYCAALCLALAPAGCRWLKLGGAAADVDKQLAAVEASKQAQSPATTQAGPSSSATAPLAGPAAAVVARDGWNAALAPLPPFPAAQGYRWRHPDLESILALDADQRPDLTAALADANPIVATNAAIGLSRWGDPRGRERLAKAVAAVELRREMRCAAAEALGRLDGAAAGADLGELLDRLGRGPTGTPNYSPELHAELLYALGGRVDAAVDPHFAGALKSQEVAVRLAAVRAVGQPGEGKLPEAAADLRSDQEHRIRAAALEAMVARRHPLALQAARAALNDYRLEVRLAAVSALGDLGGDEARQALKQLEHEPEVIRAAVVKAWAKLGSREEVWAAAHHASWRVRQAAAEALTRWPDAGGASLARQLIKDQSVEVQKQTIATLASWPLDAAAPILFAALEEGGYFTRKTAAAQFAERWPAAAEFTVDAPADRRAETLAALHKTWGQTHPLTDYAAASEAATAGVEPAELSPERLRSAEAIIRRVQEAPPTGGAMRLAVRELNDFGPDLLPALERLSIAEHVVLPDVVYRDVLAKRGPEFDAVDRLTAVEPIERRQAAAKLADQARVKPLGWLALARMAELGLGESDPLVWNSMMRAVANDPREPAVRLAYAGLSHESAEVRRLACEHLGTFSDPRHAAVLLPALEDAQRGVVKAAVLALGRPGMLEDVRPLERLLVTNDRELRLTVAQSLARLGAPSGPLALERLARDADPEIRRQTALVMGDLADPAYVDSLVGMLDDSLGVQVVALEALPKVVGRDVAQEPGNPATNTLDRISRWKRWREADRRKTESGEAAGG